MDAKVLDRMRRLCSMREYCTSDILSKVGKAVASSSDPAKETGEIMESLLKDKFIDDYRYASAFAKDKSSLSGWGTIKIRYALSAKKIEKGIIDAAISEIDSERAGEKLRKLIVRKYAALKDDPQWRLKVLRFALGRGYSYEEVDSAIRDLKF